MKRNTTVLTLCGLLIVADALAVLRTIEMWPKLASVYMASAVLAEFCVAAGTAWVAVEALRKIYRRQKKPANQSRFAVVRPLRRLFVSVWS